MTLLKRFAPVLLAGLLPTAAFADVVPLQHTAAGHAAVSVDMDGRGPRLFVLDTGASTTAVYAKARETLGLVAERDGAAQLYGAGGAATIERYRLPALSVAGVRAGDVLATGLPEGVAHGDELTGILGRDVFGDRVVEFDFPGARFGLHAPGTQPDSAAGWDVVPVRVQPDSGFVALTVQLDGKPVEAVLDTGARHSYVNWNAARQAGVSPAGAGARRSASASGVTTGRFESELARFGALQAGATALGPHELRVADLPVFEPMGLSDRAGMILGLDVIGDRRFVVDYPGQRLLIERGTAPR